MATQLQALTQPAPTDGTPGFFETLPRELRDAVYDLLYLEVTTDVEGLQFHTRTVIVELRLISRQFRLEYDEQSDADEQKKHLTITDHEKFYFHGWDYGEPAFTGIAMGCPALARRTTNLMLNLIACLGKHNAHVSCEADHEVEWHINWIESLCLHSLPHLRKIRVRLDLVSTSCISEVLKQAKLFTTLPNLVDVKIAGSTSLESIGSADDSVLLATWTKQQGLQQDHEAIELYRKRHADNVVLA